MTEMKRCGGATKAGCKSVRLSEPHMEPKENFNKNSAKPDGLASKCKGCTKLYNDSKKLCPKVAPPEFMTCRECGETKHHSAMKNDSNSINGKSKICFECKNSYDSQWAKDNPEKARAKRQRRKDRLRSQPNEEVSKEVLLEIHGNRCYLCGKPVPENIGDWDLEHVIPTSRGKVGTTYANCRVACRKCNRSKWDKTYFEYEIQRSTHYVTIENLYLFNEVYEWHMETFWAELRRNQPHLLKGNSQ